MTKVFITIAAMSLIFGACSSDNGRKVEANEAQIINVQKSESTIELVSVDKRSNIDWRASHLGGTGKRFGKISLKNATVLVNNNEMTNGKFIIDMRSFTVDNFGEDKKSEEKLSGHLQSADFFDVVNFPISTFEISKVNYSKSNGFNSEITGNLTIKNVTKSITFLANVSVSGDVVSIESEDFAVDRRSWGLTYNVEGSVGVPAEYLISNDIGFTIDVIVSK